MGDSSNSDGLAQLRLRDLVAALERKGTLSRRIGQGGVSCTIEIPGVAPVMLS